MAIEISINLRYRLGKMKSISSNETKRPIKVLHYSSIHTEKPQTEESFQKALQYIRIWVE